MTRDHKELISREQVEAFRKDGVIVVRQAIDRAGVIALRNAIERDIQRPGPFVHSYTPHLDMSKLWRFDISAFLF